MLTNLSRWLQRTKASWVGSIALAFGLGLTLGIFLTYATSVEHPTVSTPIRVDYCFLFSHEDLFSGQPVETNAHFIQGIAGIGKDECPENVALFAGPPEDDPIGKEWDIDRKKSGS